MTWLDPEDVAAAVDFLVPQPAYVNLQQITIVPTRQPSWRHDVVRSDLLGSESGFTRCRAVGRRVRVRGA